MQLKKTGCSGRRRGRLGALRSEKIRGWIDLMGYEDLADG